MPACAYTRHTQPSRLVTGRQHAENFTPPFLFLPSSLFPGLPQRPLSLVLSLHDDAPHLFFSSWPRHTFEVRAKE